MDRGSFLGCQALTGHFLSQILNSAHFSTLGRKNFQNSAFAKHSDFCWEDIDIFKVNAGNLKSIYSFLLLQNSKLSLHQETFSFVKSHF